MWMCGVCMSEGKLNPAGVAGAGRQDSLGQGTSTIAADTPRAVRFGHKVHTILKGREALSRNSSTIHKQPLDTACDLQATPAKILLPHPHTLGPYDFYL